jgi:hypothetical protein
MMWEFFLVPELQLDMMEQRTKLKVELRTDRVKEEYEPVEDVKEVEQFVNHAREMVRGVNYSTKSVTRRANNVAHASTGPFSRTNYDGALLTWSRLVRLCSPGSQSCGDAPILTTEAQGWVRGICACSCADTV